MFKKLLAGLIVTSMIWFLYAFSYKDTGTVTVTVTGLRNSNGSVLIALFDKENGFPKDAQKLARGKVKANIRNGSATATFNDLEYGRYAVSILHDENNNLEMDANMVGIPKEGYGFSNNAKGKFGPPSFDKAAFSVNKQKTAISIATTYF